MKPSGIGGQAVIEGIMMRNKDVYSVAVRKPDNEIEVIRKESKLLTEKYKILNLPIIRGVINFVESLVVGTSTLTYSASFFEDPQEQEPTRVDHIAKAVFKDKLESVVMAVTIIISIGFAIGLFMILPYFVSRLLSKYIVSKSVLNLIEGLIRVVIFIVYIVLISLMKDIKRVYMYHGAEHKCINCIEHGLELNVENVRKSSKQHKRCGTSFLFFVMFISVIFFVFINVSNPFWQVGIRLLLVPVIAGVSYEVIRWAGRSETTFVKVISVPGMWLQGLTTREPDDDMIEVAIKAVEEVFDWKKFLEEYDENKKDVNKVSNSNENTDEHDIEYAVTNESKQEEILIEKAVELADSIEQNEDSDENHDSNEDDSDEDDSDEDSNQNKNSDKDKDSDDENDDGISFINEDEDDDSISEVIPIFKQRKTDL